MKHTTIVYNTIEEIINNVIKPLYLVMIFNHTQNKFLLKITHNYISLDKISEEFQNDVLDIRVFSDKQEERMWNFVEGKYNIIENKNKIWIEYILNHKPLCCSSPIPFLYDIWINIFSLTEPFNFS